MITINRCIKQNGTWLVGFTVNGKHMQNTGTILHNVMNLSLNYKGIN